MDVGTNIKPHLQGRHGATVLHWLFAADAVSKDVSWHHEIFKKTPFVSGLHSVSRDVVKDIPEIDSIPLLTTTVLDQDVPEGLVSTDFAIAGRQIAENSTAVTPHSHQDVLRSADERTAAGGVVGVRGNQVVDASATVAALHPEHSNGNLTDRGWGACTSRWAAGATNAGAGDVSFVEQNRFFIAGASLLGGDLENHSYADI